MNKAEETGQQRGILPTVGSSDIGLTMAGIGSGLGLGLTGEVLDGEVRDLAGVLNPEAAYEVQRLETSQGVTSDGDWGYYAKRAGAPGQWLKAWVRWNAQEAVYDYYLAADAGGVFDHATPYVGPVYEIKSAEGWERQ